MASSHFKARVGRAGGLYGAQSSGPGPELAGGRGVLRQSATRRFVAVGAFQSSYERSTCGILLGRDVSVGIAVYGW
jgi:hypothetical protein